MIRLNYLKDLNKLINLKKDLEMSDVSEIKKKTLVAAIANAKGGVGKSTFIINLAHWYATQGKSVLLVDADIQKTATAFDLINAQNKAERIGNGSVKVTSITTSIPEVVNDNLGQYDVILIDTPGHESSQMKAALLVSNIALFPSAPSAFDINVVQTVMSIIHEVKSSNRKLKSFFFMNMVDRRATSSLRKSQGFMKTIISDCYVKWNSDSDKSGIYQLDSFISLKEQYKSMGFTGKTIFEMKGGKGDPTIEHNALMTEVYQTLKNAVKVKEAA